MTLALGVRETVAGRRLVALEGGGGYLPPFQCTPALPLSSATVPPSPLPLSLTDSRPPPPAPFDSGGDPSPSHVAPQPLSLAHTHSRLPRGPAWKLMTPHLEPPMAVCGPPDWRLDGMGKRRMWRVLWRGWANRHPPPPLLSAFIPPPPPRDALEGKGPQRRPQRRLGRPLEEVTKAVGGRLLSVTNAIEAGTWRQGHSGWA